MSDFVLPVVDLATGSVEIGGKPVPIRSLSRDDVSSLALLGSDTAAAESFLIAKGTGVTEDAAQAWRQSVDAKTAMTLITAISVLSGLRAGRDEAGKS